MAAGGPDRALTFRRLSPHAHARRPSVIESVQSVDDMCMRADVGSASPHSVCMREMLHLLTLVR